MFLSISVDGPGADTLSFIVQKHPEKVFERDNLRLFFPKYEKEMSSVVAMVEFPEYKLWNADTPQADAYVSSREYALSSLFCRELKAAFGTAIRGQYKDEKDKALAETPLDLVVDALPFATSLTDEQIRGLFKPLGYHGFTPSFSVDHSYQHPWMPQKHRVVEVAIRGRKTVREVLRHLLVLIPVIDNYTHYSELETLVAELKAHGDGWLDQHPMKDFITGRFLRHRKQLVKEFNGPEEKKEGEDGLEKRIFLGELRTKWLVGAVKASGAKSVVDAGCGSGRLAEALNDAGVLNISAFDCHTRAVATAKYHLKNKADVFFSSLMYRDDRLLGKDAFVLQEVIEHLSPFQLQRAVDLIFGTYRPKAVIMSTPNRSYNKVFGMPDGQFRHKDHKFEWDEAEARAFVDHVEKKYGYAGAIALIGLDYVPPSAQESAEINERMGRPPVYTLTVPKDKQESFKKLLAEHPGGDLMVADLPMAMAPLVSPTFGIVFERKN